MVVKLDKKCIDCNVSIDHRSTRCRSCTCVIRNKTTSYKKEKNNAWKGYKNIPFTWFSKYFLRNKKRTGTITIEDIYRLWILQDMKCNLSGVPINWSDDGPNGHTCSIDRIDSKKEYTLDNIQLVHKDINLMKNRFSQDYFTTMCEKVTHLLLNRK